MINGNIDTGVNGLYRFITIGMFSAGILKISQVLEIANVKEKKYSAFIFAKAVFDAFLI